MENIHFTRIKQKDIPELQSDAKAIWYECYTGIISNEQIEYMLDWMYSTEKISNEMKHENIDYYFIFNEDKKIGFFSVGPFLNVTEQAKLHKLYLYPEFHGRGFGSTSLRKIFDLACSQGYSSLRLNVNKNNKSAIKAYERNGFKKYKEIVDDIGNGYVMDDYIMIKDISIS